MSVLLLNSKYRNMTESTIEKLNDSIRRIRNDPMEYLNIAHDLKWKIDVVLEALHGSAALKDVALQERLFAELFCFLPLGRNSSQFHIMRIRTTQVLNTCNPSFIQVYLQQAGPKLMKCVFFAGRDKDPEWDVLQGYFVNLPQIFNVLPRELQTDPWMIKALINHKSDDHELEMILQDTPSDVFTENVFLVLDLIHRCQRFDQDCWHLVPVELWRDTAVRRLLVLSVPKIPLSVFPTEFCSDRSFFFDIFKDRSGRIIPLEENIPNLMAASLKADKEFIMKCVRRDPFMLFHCAKRLQSDMDIFVQAARTAIKRNEFSEQFITDRGGRFETFMEAILVAIFGLDFKSFFACCSKCILDESMHDHPLRLLDCGLETSVAWKRQIRSYVLDTETTVRRLTTILDKVVSILVERDMPQPRFFQLLPEDSKYRTLMKGLRREDVADARHAPMDVMNNDHGSVENDNDHSDESDGENGCPDLDSAFESDDDADRGLASESNLFDSDMMEFGVYAELVRWLNRNTIGNEDASSSDEPAQGPRRS